VRKVLITQDELDQGDGNFHDYMSYVRDRLAAKFIEPKDALFAAAQIIGDDGFEVRIGTDSNGAGLAISNWLRNFYGDRQNISYCFPHIAYQINGAIYHLRMPIFRVKDIPILDAVIALTVESAKRLSKKQLDKLQSDYNEFYSIFYDISRLDVTTVIHLESAADRLLTGAAHYALSRWESLHFIERAIKEVLEPKGIRLSGGDGHDISGALHRAWIAAGLQPLPESLLTQVMCPPSIRYQKTPHPFLASINAHHASIRLGALIAREIPAVPRMTESLMIRNSDIAREGPLAIARVFKALDKTSDNWPTVRLMPPG